MRPQTIVSLHAHPDDETLLTGGTLARLHAEGHRVVVVVATDGALGLTARRHRRGLATARRRELEAACEALGVDRLVTLQYPDSGMRDEGPTDRFTTRPVRWPAARVAAVLVEEDADVLTIYDRAGGYGHPDHVHVHHVGLAAAKLACTPRILQATADRARLRRVLRAVEWVPGLPEGFSSDAVGDKFAEPSELTHRVDVREFASAKRAAMEAHHSQATSDTGDRTLALALRLPPALFRVVFGHEWFAEVEAPRRRSLLTNPLEFAGRSVGRPQRLDVPMPTPAVVRRLRSLP